MDSQIKLNGDRPIANCYQRSPSHEHPVLDRPGGGGEDRSANAKGEGQGVFVWDDVRDSPKAGPPPAARMGPSNSELLCISLRTLPLPDFFPTQALVGVSPSQAMRVCVHCLGTDPPLRRSLCTLVTNSHAAGRSSPVTLLPTSVVPCRVSVPLICTRVCAHLRPL